MFGKNIYSEEIPSFPELPEEYFKIKDEKTIREMMELYEKSTDLLPINGPMSDQFRLKQQQLLNVFTQLDTELKDNLSKPDLYQPESNEYTIATPFKNFDYYNLTDVTFDQKEAAFEASKYLGRNQNSISQKFSEMQIEAKPIKSNQQHKLIKKMELLSFQDNQDY